MHATICGSHRYGWMPQCVGVTDTNTRPRCVGVTDMDVVVTTDVVTTTICGSYRHHYAPQYVVITVTNARHNMS